MHPRHRIVATAGVELGQAINEIAERHDLTYAELFGLLGGTIQSWAKYAVREERHPGTDRPGDLECGEDCQHPHAGDSS